MKTCIRNSEASFKTTSCKYLFRQPPLYCLCVYTLLRLVMADSIWQFFGNSAITLPTIIYTRHDKTRQRNFQNSDEVHVMIILAYASYVEASIMNSQTRYSDQKRVVFFEKIKYICSNFQKGALGKNCSIANSYQQSNYTFCKEFMLL